MLKERRGFSNLLPYEKNQYRKQSTNYTISINEKLFAKNDDAANEITIKFVGDLKQNISEITSSLKCTQQCKLEVKNILSIYAKKISKLRQERNFYKQLLLMNEEKNKEEMAKLKNRITDLQEKAYLKNHFQSNLQRCTCFDTNDFSTEKFSQFNKNSLTIDFSHSKITNKSFSIHNADEEDSNLIQSIKSRVSKSASSKVQQMLIQNVKDSNDNNELILPFAENSSKIPSQSTLKTISEEQLIKLMIKYNFNVEQLQQILDQYEKEHKMADQMFDSQNQRQLYKLGNKMQKDLWSRKVVQDVKRLSLIKNSTKK